MAEHWFPDNSVICNFGAVDQLSLLKGYLRGRGRVVEAVAREITQSSSWVPALLQLDQQEWFGEPIVISEEADRNAVEQMRRHQFGGTVKEPKKHLGESQTLHVIQSTGFEGSTWITDDGDAYAFGRRRQIVTKNTFEVLQALVAFGEITSDSAFELMVRMDECDRGLMYQPTSAREFL